MFQVKNGLQELIHPVGPHYLSLLDGRRGPHGAGRGGRDEADVVQLEARRLGPLPGRPGALALLLGGAGGGGPLHAAALPPHLRPLVGLAGARLVRLSLSLLHDGALEVLLLEPLRDEAPAADDGEVGRGGEEVALAVVSAAGDAAAVALRQRRRRRARREVGQVEGDRLACGGGAAAFCLEERVIPARSRSHRNADVLGKGEQKFKPS